MRSRNQHASVTSCFRCLFGLGFQPESRLSMFTELRAHTAFSFGDGAVSPEALARRARRLGYSHLGVTDCADFGGLAKFAVEAVAPAKDPECSRAANHERLGKSDCEECQRVVKPIVGAELEIDGQPA